MAAYVPTSAAAGVPCKRPVVPLNDAQAGLPEIVNESVSPSASLAVGVKLNCVPCSTDASGVPEIVGAELPPPGAGAGAGGAAEFAAGSSPPSPQAAKTAASATTASSSDKVRIRDDLDFTVGNPAVMGQSFRPVALRLRLSTDLPLARSIVPTTQQRRNLSPLPDFGSS